MSTRKENTPAGKVSPKPAPATGLPSDERKAADPTEETLCLLERLLGEEHFAQLENEVRHPCRRADPVFDLVYHPFWEDFPFEAGPDWRAHTCALTEKKFALPMGSPVPAITYAYLNCEGKDLNKDGERLWMIVHPEIAGQGAVAVVEALGRRVVNLKDELMERFIDLVETVRMAEHIRETATLRQAWPAYWMQHEGRQKAPATPNAKPNLHNVKDLGY